MLNAHSMWNVRFSISIPSKSKNYSPNEKQLINVRLSGSEHCVFMCWGRNGNGAQSYQPCHKFMYKFDQSNVYLFSVSSAFCFYFISSLLLPCARVWWVYLHVRDVQQSPKHHFNWAYYLCFVMYEWVNCCVAELRLMSIFHLIVAFCTGSGRHGRLSSSAPSSSSSTTSFRDCHRLSLLSGAIWHWWLRARTLSNDHLTPRSQMFILCMCVCARVHKNTYFTFKLRIKWMPNLLNCKQ